MGLLAPEFTGPVTLKMEADDVRREALGRTLGIAGAITGLTGAVMLLSANPALKSAIKGEKATSLTLTADEARRDAMGKTIGLLGMGVGLVGTAISMSASADMRKKLPLLAKVTDPAGIALTLVAVGGLLAFMVRSQNIALKKRYGIA